MRQHRPSCEAPYIPKDFSVRKIDAPVHVRETYQLRSDNKFWSNCPIIMIGCRSLQFSIRHVAASPAEPGRLPRKARAGLLEEKAHLMRLPALFSSALLLVVLVRQAPCHAQESPGAGYGLYRSTSAVWSWTPVATNGPLANLNSSADGRRLVFSVPVQALQGFNKERMRVGVVSGVPGSTPEAWISPGKSYQGDTAVGRYDVPDLVAEAELRKAEVRITDDQLQVEIEFDTPPTLRSPWDLYLLVDADGNEANGFQGADYLVQDCALKGEEKGPLHVAWFELHPGIVKPGERVEATAWIENTAHPVLPYF